MTGFMEDFTYHTLLELFDRPIIKTSKYEFNIESNSRSIGVTDCN